MNPLLEEITYMFRLKFDDLMFVNGLSDLKILVWGLWIKMKTTDFPCRLYCHASRMSHAIESPKNFRGLMCTQVANFAASMFQKSSQNGTDLLHLNTSEVTLLIR